MLCNPNVKLILLVIPMKQEYIIVIVRDVLGAITNFLILFMYGRDVVATAVINVFFSH